MASSVGLGPNELNNRYQDVHAAWNPTPAYPTLTVATSLGGTTSVLPTRQPTTATHHVANHGTTPGLNISNLSIVIGNERFCRLQKADGVPCQVHCPKSSRATFASHVIDVHIAGELNRMKNRQLDRRDAQILCTKARVKRAKDYAWRCPHGCYVRMREDTVRRHCERSLLHKHHPLQAYQRGRMLKTGPKEVLKDILAASE